MIGLLCFVLAVLASPFKSKLRLEAENAVLRHQLNVGRRRLPGRVRLTNHDRWFFIQLYRWFHQSCRFSQSSGPRHSCGGTGRLSPLLALEIASTGTAATNRDGAAEWVARQITEAFPWDGAPGSATAIGSTAPWSRADCAPWASGTDLP